MRRSGEKPLTEQERIECFKLISRGKQVRNLYASELWKKHLNPLLASKKQEILAENHFKPGSDIPSIERIAILNAFNGGRIHVLDDIFDQLAQWENLANHAEQKLSLDKLKEKP